MKCIRLMNTAGLPILAPLLLDDETMSREMMLQALAVRLINKDPTLYIAMTFDDKDEKCVGYGIAEAHPAQRHVFIYQTRVLPEGGRQAGDLMFSRLVEWTRHIGRREIRAETKRNPEAFLRGRGFRTVATIIGYTVDDPAQDLFFGIGGSDGRQQLTGGVGQPDGGSGTDGPDAVPVPVGASNAGDGAGSGSGRGSASGEQVPGTAGAAERSAGLDSGGSTGGMDDGEQSRGQREQSVRSGSGDRNPERWEFGTSGDGSSGSDALVGLPPAPAGTSGTVATPDSQGRQRSFESDFDKRDQNDGDTGPSAGDRPAAGGTPTSHAGPEGFQLSTPPGSISIEPGESTSDA